jgi:hypothetical protein
MAQCPSHADNTPSLSVGRGTGGKTLLFCHGGCTTEAVLTSLGMELGDLFDGDDRKKAEETQPPDRWPVTATYTYEAADGTPVYRVLRKTSQDSGRKTFRQERFEGGKWLPGMDNVVRVLYRAPSLVDPELADETVFVTEGERDAENLAAIGVLVTTNVGGAGKWLPAYSEALRKRHVVVLPDNDKPGEEHAAVVSKALDGIAASVKVLRLPGLPEKGDVSDWIGNGGTAEQLRAMVDRLATGASFMPSPKRLVGERADRVQAGKTILSFGVKFLDDAMGGITRRDLILVGAKTGAGKTQLALNVAIANCRAGRRVHYFALEAEDREMERRMKFQILASAYYRHAMGAQRLRFIDWYNGKLDGVLEIFEDRADREVAELLKNLNTYYRVDTFTGADFSRQLDAIREETDLVVLDHFHYVDSDDENENRGHKQLVKQIRDCALRADRPVMVVGHVRKSDPRNAPLVPTEEAFHGSSDIVKIATKAIMLAPDYETDTGNPSLWATYMQIVKCRQDSSLTRYAARLIYDTRTDGYQPEYSLGRLTEGGKKYESLSPWQWPMWKAGAQSADDMEVP